MPGGSWEEFGDASEVEEEKPEASDDWLSAGEIVKNAEDEARSIKEKAAKDIEQDRKKVMDQARGEISDMAVEIAEKLVKKELDMDGQDALIQQFINEFEAR